METLFFDSDNREWIRGIVDKRSNPIYSYSSVKPLPYLFDGMHLKEDPEQDLSYCSCAFCGIPTRIGRCVLIFLDSSFSVRLSCMQCVTKDEKLVYVNYPIISVMFMISPIIRQGFATKCTQCAVCDKQKCKSDECQEILRNGIIEESENEKMFGHFYRIKLDILSIFVKRVMYCGNCGEELGNFKFSCGTCKSFVYCSNICKAKHVTNCPGGVQRIWV